MGGIATADLAVAVSRAGGFGMLSGANGAEALAMQLDAVPLDLSVGVNFLIPFLDRAAVEDAAGRSALVEFFWGVPDVSLVDLVHSGGARACWQVGSTDEARAAVNAGCDVIVVQGVEAGGHVRGDLSLFALLDQVRAIATVPIVAAGGIGSGRSMAAALVAGADAVRVGTRFVAAVESPAHQAYVDALTGARAEDTVVTTAFGDGWPDAPHRVLKSALAAGAALGDAQTWSPEWPMAESTGVVEARALYAGQSVGSVRGRQPACDIVDGLVAEAEQALSRASALS